MVRNATLIFALAVLLASCSSRPTTRFAGEVNDAKQAGRPIVVYEINPRTGANEYSGPVGVYFINTAAEALQSVTFDLLPYRHYHAVRRAIKKFTEKGPFAPGHAYKFLSPEPAWPKLKGFNDCVTLVGMAVSQANGRVIHIKENEIDHYLTPNVATACGQRSHGLIGRGDALAKRGASA